VYVLFDRVIDVDRTVGQTVQAILASDIATDDFDKPGGGKVILTGDGESRRRDR